MPSKVRWRPTEPGRDPLYVKLLARINNQDGCITFLLVELRALQRRVTKLEQHNDILAAAALRRAHNNAEEFREQEQHPAEMNAP